MRTLPLNAVSANDAGIMTNGDIIITDSDVKATSEFPVLMMMEMKSGIFAIGGENISISGGTVTAVSTGKYANGIYGFSSVRISDNAEVVAETSNEDSWPCDAGHREYLSLPAKCLRKVVMQASFLLKLSPLKTVQI